jgi:hypothetical protein
VLLLKQSSTIPSIKDNAVAAMFAWLFGSWNSRRWIPTKNTRAAPQTPSRLMPTGDLWDLIMDMDWERVIQHAREHPQDAAYSDGHYHESVLYLACQHNPPVAAIRAILQAYPEAALQVSRAHHDLPLHIAARYQLSAEILEELLKDFPTTAVEQTRFGRTPLMALWEFRHKSTSQQGSEQEPDGLNHDSNQQRTVDQEEEEFWNKVMVILRAVARFREDPEYHSQTAPSARKKEFLTRSHRRIDSDYGHKKRVANAPNSHADNRFILHAAVSLGALSCPIDVLEYVLRRFPEQVSKRDRWGYLPLHIAVSPAPWNGSTRRKYRPREQQFVAALLRAHPDAARTRLCDSAAKPDNYGDCRYPLMTALSNRHAWSGGVWDLFRAAPEVLQFRDPVTGLYPFQLAAVPSGETTNDLDTIFELLRAQPQVMILMDTTSAWKGRMLQHSKALGVQYGPRPMQSLSMAAEIPLLGTVTAALIGVLAGILGSENTFAC